MVQAQVHPGLVVQTCDPNSEEAEMGGVWVQRYPRTQSETLSLKQTTDRETPQGKQAAELGLQFRFPYTVNEKHPSKCETKSLKNELLSGHLVWNCS